MCGWRRKNTMKMPWEIKFARKNSLLMLLTLSLIWHWLTIGQRNLENLNLFLTHLRLFLTHKLINFNLAFKRHLLVFTYASNFQHFLVRNEFRKFIFSSFSKIDELIPKSPTWFSIITDTFYCCFRLLDWPSKSNF